MAVTNVGSECDGLFFLRCQLAFPSLSAGFSFAVSWLFLYCLLVFPSLSAYKKHCSKVQCLGEIVMFVKQFYDEERTRLVA